MAYEKTPSLLYGNPGQQSRSNLNIEAFFRKDYFSINIMLFTICAKPVDNLILSCGYSH